MKYIITRDQNSVEEIFTFPDSIHHDIMAQLISRMRNHSQENWIRVERVPVSAGFIKDNICCGYSETLKLSSRADDTNLFLNQ